MRILRVHLKDFRGVEDREVHFDPVGLTVVEGPNESGKSSLALAIDVIFDHLDDSKKEQVRSLKPVDRDAGSEVELEIETGPYRFTYFKRFNKNKETRLKVTLPRPENLTGREAHARAQQILEETLDVPLWKALRIVQGRSFDQASLEGERDLSRALDLAAGGSRTGERENSLYDAAKCEYLAYFTPTGRAQKELAECGRALESARNDVSAREEDIRRLERDIDRSAALDRRIADLHGSREERARNARERESRLEEVRRLREGLKALEAQRDAALERVKRAATARDERKSLREQLAALEQALGDMEEQAGANQPALTEAVRRTEEAEKKRAETRKRHEQAQAMLRIRESDESFRREGLDLTLLRERKERVDKANTAAREAQEILAASRIDGKLLGEIVKAEQEVHRAEARLDAQSPSVKIEALAPISPQVDGTAVNLKKGASTSHPVVDALEVTFPGVAHLTVTRGESAATLQANLARARERLREVLAQAGAGDAAEATAALERRQDAQRKIEARNEALGRELRDLTLEEMEAKIARLEGSTSAYPGGRAADFPLPADLGGAKALLTEAKREAELAVETLARADQELDGAVRRRTGLESDRREMAGRMDEKRNARDAARVRLREARTVMSDEDLETGLLRDQAALQDQEGRVRDALLRIEALDPEQVETLAQAAASALTQVEKDLRESEIERAEVRARLEDRGEKGLAEELDAARSSLLRCERRQAGLAGRAAAARLLYETLADERERAQRNYIAPLRERIEHLGRYVFGEGFQVEIDQSLSVLSRTLEGRKVPWDSLSVGAREQISVIARLACALIVAAEGGVPLIIDDALGNTDPARLERMGAVLSVGARDCQIIVLTCYPERYRAVANARVETLR